MFYEPHARDRTRLPHDPFKAIIAPRPIGWVTSRSRAGAVNLAPYSFFNALADRPPILAFSSAGWKDSVAFIEETGEFVWNMPTFALREAMNQTSASFSRGVCEAKAVGLELAPSERVAPPRVAASPAALECVSLEIKRLHDRSGAAIDYWLVLGEVVGVHIDETLIREGRFDMATAAPIARCGYDEYVVARETFSMSRPPPPRED